MQSIAACCDRPCRYFIVMVVLRGPLCGGRSHRSRGRIHHAASLFAGTGFLSAHLFHKAFRRLKAGCSRPHKSGCSWPHKSGIDERNVHLKIVPPYSYPTHCSELVVDKGGSPSVGRQRARRAVGRCQEKSSESVRRKSHSDHAPPARLARRRLC